MKRAIVLAAAICMLGASSPVWLDAATPAKWNEAGAAIPAAPGGVDAELAPGGRCASELRPPSTPEDRSLMRKGWFLIGPYQRYGRTSVVLATSNADGMCRPNGYQGFVFVSGVFAGTLSPHIMDSRTDASISGLGIELDNDKTLEATFARYTESDPLCCPHASTVVSYDIEARGSNFVVEPISAQTSKNP